MRSLPQRYFGPSGLPCIFTIDDETGATSIGYLVKQVSTNKYMVSDGTITRLCRFPTTLEQVSDLNNFPPATFTIELTMFDDSLEYIFEISETRCSTLQGTAIAWHTADPTQSKGGILPPDMGSDILLEDGSKWLLEDGSKWLLESA